MTIGHDAAAVIVGRAAARYFAERRRMVPDFAARNFGVRRNFAQYNPWEAV